MPLDNSLLGMKAASYSRFPRVAKPGFSWRRTASSIRYIRHLR